MAFLKLYSEMLESPLRYQRKVSYKYIHLFVIQKMCAVYKKLKCPTKNV